MIAVLANKLRLKLKSAYARITLNKITAGFFIFSFVHCFAQGIIQSMLFSVDSEYNTLLSQVVDKAEIPSNNMTFLTGGPGNLRLYMCNEIPQKTVNYCMEIFVSGSPYDLSLTAIEEVPAVSDVLAVATARNGSDLVGVDVSFSGGSSLLLSQQCTQILLYADQVTQLLRHEDITLIFLQFWLFSISFIAILYDSIPHTLSVLLARVLVTAWSVYAVARTVYTESVFNEMITNVGTPCHVDLFPSYFRTRTAYEIPDLVLNWSALLIALYLSWTLLRVYNSQSFKCVGPPRHIVRIYRFFMAVFVCLQLELFVLLAAMILWVDHLLHTYLIHYSEHTPAYKAIFIGTPILLVPWIALGWFAVRRENKLMMSIFLFLGVVFTTCWGAMFDSIIYRWTLVQWPFMTAFTAMSFVLLLTSMVLGVICWLNFNKGLAHYLNADDALASANFKPQVFAHSIELSEKERRKKIDAFGVEKPQPAYYVGALPSGEPHHQSVAYNVSFPEH